MNQKDQMKVKQGGMFWDEGFDFKIPKGSDIHEATFTFEKNVALITWNTVEQHHVPKTQRKRAALNARLAGVIKKQRLTRFM